MAEFRRCPRCQRAVPGMACASRFGTRRVGIAWRCLCGFTWRTERRGPPSPEPAASEAPAPSPPSADGPAYVFSTFAPACPSCGAKTKVTSTRLQETPPMRWRKCVACGATLKQLAEARP